MTVSNRAPSVAAASPTASVAAKGGAARTQAPVAGFSGALADAENQTAPTEQDAAPEGALAKDVQPSTSLLPVPDALQPVPTAATVETAQAEPAAAADAVLAALLVAEGAPRAAAGPVAVPQGGVQSAASVTAAHAVLRAAARPALPSADAGVDVAAPNEAWGSRVALAGGAASGQADAQKRVADAWQRQASVGEMLSGLVDATSQMQQKNSLDNSAEIQALAASATAAPRAETLLAGGVPLTQFREERAQERFHTPLGESLLGGVTGVSSSAAAMPDVAVMAAGTAVESQVAEQVAYWVSKDIQHAELKLEGEGQAAVEVSIRMQGNEAQVAFRSDEAHTRALLEQASTHLKDVLQRDGVVLTGVSVGTSHSNHGAGAGKGGQERRAPNGARQASVAVALPAPRAAARTGLGAGLDLFV